MVSPGLGLGDRFHRCIHRNIASLPQVMCALWSVVSAASTAALGAGVSTLHSPREVAPLPMMPRGNIEPHCLMVHIICGDNPGLPLDYCLRCHPCREGESPLPGGCGVPRWLRVTWGTRLLWRGDRAGFFGEYGWCHWRVRLGCNASALLEAAVSVPRSTGALREPAQLAEKLLQGV